MKKSTNVRGSVRNFADRVLLILICLIILFGIIGMIFDNLKSSVKISFTLFPLLTIMLCRRNMNAGI